MITQNNTFPNYPKQYYGLSTDTKPTVGVVNGSMFYEMDKTGEEGDERQRVYMFDAASTTWIEQG